jgi:transketolase
VGEALAAADRLAGAGASPTVAVLAHLGLEASPALVELLAAHRHVVTVEDGYTTGGLASLTAETIARRGLGCRLLARGVGEPLGGASGSEAFMRAAHGLDGAALAAATQARLEGRD